MPWRKYNSRNGKHGPIYHIAKGVQVRRDARGSWLLFVRKGEERKNKTVGEGRSGLRKAIKAAEAVALQLTQPGQDKVVETAQSKAPHFRSYSNDWLEGNYGRWAENTCERYEGILRTHIWPNAAFKGKRLDEISRSDIKVYLRKLLKIRAPASVELAHTVLCSIFEEALDDEIIESNPARGLQRKTLPPKRLRDLKEPEPFDLEERDRFLARAEKKCSWSEQLILKVMVHTGLRLGEALAMRLRYLDLRNMTYYVAESYKQYKFIRPKRGKKRLVDLPNFLVNDLGSYVTHLKKEALRRGLPGEADLLFRDPKEKRHWPYSQRKIQALLRRVCTGAGLRVRNPHDLRHTYATIMLMAHQSPAYVQRQLGHSSISITVDIYGHWIPGEGRRGLEEALLGLPPNRPFADAGQSPKQVTLHNNQQVFKKIGNGADDSTS